MSKTKTKLLREKDLLAKRLGDPDLTDHEAAEIDRRLNEISGQLVEIAQAHQMRPPVAPTGR